MAFRESVDSGGDAHRLFGLRWQTLQDIASRTASTASPPCDRILTDVAKFLDRLGLSGFDGWKNYPDLSGVTPTPAPWATPFRTIADLNITPTPARWTHAL